MAWLLAGIAAALVLLVVVVLAMRSGSKPKPADGPPVAAKGPGGDDRPKDADKAEDTDPDRKKDKTDTPEKPAPLPRLAAFPKVVLPERGAAGLQVNVDRQGYAGPIKLQVENLPPGVTCQRSATIPAGESALRLEFRTDGTAAEGTATVEVIALADAQTADRQTLSLVVPPKTVVPSAKMFPGLLAYWPFDEGEGDSPADVSGSVRGKGHNIEWVDGVRGKAIHTKGRGSYFDFSAHPKLNFAAGADFTFCGWVRTRQKDGPILSNRADADGTPDIDLHVGSGTLRLEVRQQGATDYIATLKGAKAVSDGAWHHFAFTRQGADLALYTDGALQQRLDNTRSGGAIPTDLRALGAELYWLKSPARLREGLDTDYLAGDFDEFCVFGRALSAAEIRTLAGKKVPD